MMPLMTLLVLALLAGALSTTALLGRRAARNTDDARAVIVTAFWLAVVTAGLIVVFGLIEIVSTLVSPELAVRAPIHLAWPVTENASPGDLAPAIESGGVSTATLELSGLSIVTRGVLATAAVLGSAVSLANAALVAIACRHALRGRPFDGAVARAAAIAATVVAFGGLAAQAIGGFGSRLAVDDVLAGRDSPAEGCGSRCADLATWWPEQATLFEIGLWPIGAGLALAALSVIWRRGATLERDTQGLV